MQYVATLCAATLVLGAADPTKPETLTDHLARLGYQQGPAVDRIRSYTLDGWQSLDNTHFMMDAGPSLYYLITLPFPCIGLNAAENFSFTTTPPGDLTRMDQIIVHDPAVPQHCPIKALNTLVKLKKEQEN